MLVWLDVYFLLRIIKNGIETAHQIVSQKPTHLRIRDHAKAVFQNIKPAHCENDNGPP
jgi:hypothetical protein